MGQFRTKAEAERYVRELEGSGSRRMRVVYEGKDEALKGLVLTKSADQVIATMNQIGHGKEKFTSLVDLGHRLGGTPEALHAMVLQLWRAGKITVSAAEGRSGSTPEERRWWLQAQGETLGYVMLRG